MRRPVRRRGRRGEVRAVRRGMLRETWAQKGEEGVSRRRAGQVRAHLKKMGRLEYRRMFARIWPWKVLLRVGRIQPAGAAVRLRRGRALPRRPRRVIRRRKPWIQDRVCGLLSWHWFRRRSGRWARRRGRPRLAQGRRALIYAWGRRALAWTCRRARSTRARRRRRLMRTAFLAAARAVARLAR